MKHCVIVFFIIFFNQVNLWAQERFTMNSNIGCAPFTVVVTEDVAVTGSTNTQYDFGVGEGYTTATSYTYEQPGEYIIEQIVDNDLLPGGKQDYKTIVVVEGAVEPQVTYYMCNNRQIFVTVPDDTYPSYWIDFGDGNSQQAAPNQETSHTYADIVTKNLAVVGLINGTQNVGDEANNDCGVFAEPIIPLDVLPVPTINQVTVLDQNRVELRYNIAEYLHFQIEVSENGNTNFTPIESIPSISGTYIAEGLDTKNNFYCFRIALKDPCNNTNPDVYSNTICSSATRVTAENNQNVISWNLDPDNIQSIDVYKGDILYTTLNATETSFTDTDVMCNVEYCYNLRFYYTQGISRTERICVNAVTENIPPQLNNININVFENELHIEWPDPQINVKDYHIEQVNSDGTSDGSSSIQTNIHIVKGIDITKNLKCYKINYEDECGNVAPLSRDVCPILLTVSENEDHSYQLNWTEYNGWDEGVSQYTLEKIDAEGNVIETINLSAATISYTDSDYQDNQIINFRITAVSNNSENWTSHSNVVKMEQEMKVFLPTAFTPNNDQLNDTFTAKGSFIKNIEMKIFNRWGELLFYSDDINKGWDGTFKGQPAQEGSYLYTVQATDLKDKTISLSGAFMLIRNRKN